MKKMPTLMLLGVLAMIVCASTTHAEFYVKWHILGQTDPAFAGFFGTIDNSSGNLAEREKPYGILTDQPTPFVFVTRNNYGPSLVDLNTGSPYSITGMPGTLDYRAYSAQHVRVRYDDLDNDGRDEVLLWVYGWGLACIDWQLASGADEPGNELSGSALMSNTPNPLSTMTTISFNLATRGIVDLRVYDLNGRMVRELVQGKLTAGLHRVPWDGQDELENPLASGTYFYRLRVDGISIGTEKAIVLR